MSQSEAPASRTQTTPDGTGAKQAGQQSTELRLANQELNRLQSELYAQARQQAADREAVAREIHDKFGQYLTVMDLELSAILARNDISPDLRARLEKLNAQTSVAHQDMSVLAWQVRATSLDGLSLSQACEVLTQEWGGRSELAFDLHLSLGSRSLPPVVEDTLYRVLQEAVTNVAKHANATKVGIVLRVTSSNAILIVEDDGEGFPWKSSGRDTFATLGIRGMRERLALIDGSLEIETSPNHGTTLLIRVPL